MRSGGFKQAPRSFVFMTNSKLHNVQGQFGGPSNKGLNSDEIKKKGGLHMKREVQLGNCKKYHSVYLGLKKKPL